MSGKYETFPGDVFSGSADPASLYVHPTFTEASAAVTHAIRARRGIVVLTGAPGTGKTTLLRRVAEDFAANTEFAFVVNPPDNFDELLGILCADFDLARGEQTRAARMARLNEHLLAALVADRNVIVLIDDAHLLSDNVLEQLRLLTNLETSKEKLLQIVLCGDPSLIGRLAKPELRQLRDRVGVWAKLAPLRGGQVVEYVSARFRSAGLSRESYFRDADLRLIGLLAGGLPRAINTICDNALILAFAADELPVSTVNVRRAIEHITGRHARWAELRSKLPSLRVPRWAALAALVVLVAVAAISVGVYCSGSLASLVDRIVPHASAPAPSDAGDIRRDTASAVPEAPPAGDEVVEVKETSAPDNSTAKRSASRHFAVNVQSAFPLGAGARCGDGYADAGEECDDGNDDESDGCLSICREAVCGDGVVRAEVEPCDDGNDDNSDDCLFGCALARCGDGYVRAGVEACDDGNTVGGDGCSANCRTEGVGERQSARTIARSFQ